MLHHKFRFPVAGCTGDSWGLSGTQLATVGPATAGRRKTQGISAFYMVHNFIRNKL